MAKLLRVIGCVWAGPLTLVGLLYVASFSLLGWYVALGRCGDALVWQTTDKMPTSLKRAWGPRSGHTFGNVIVLHADLNTHHGNVALRHEQEHVVQSMTLGPLYPVLYLAAYLGLCCCQHAHPFWDHPFELDARRAAGQAIDVIGALKKAVADGKIKLPHKDAT